jgi:hypothetical protein
MAVAFTFPIPRNASNKLGHSQGGRSLALRDMAAWKSRSYRLHRFAVLRTSIGFSHYPRVQRLIILSGATSVTSLVPPV